MRFETIDVWFRFRAILQKIMNEYCQCRGDNLPKTQIASCCNCCSFNHQKIGLTNGSNLSTAVWPISHSLISAVYFKFTSFRMAPHTWETHLFRFMHLDIFCVNLLVIGRRWTSNLDFRQEVSKFCLRIVSHWNWTQILEWFVFKWSLWTTWVQLFGYIGYFFIYAFEDEFWWCDKWDIYTTFKLMTWTWVPKWESIYILHFEKKELTFWKLGTKTVNLEIKVKSSTLNK
jgi:hypothetical protein